VETAQKTIIECKLEKGSSSIIDVIADGTLVEKDQVLAQLDASNYEELVRLNEILLAQAQSDEQTARFDLEVAEIALKQYREGELDQLQQTYRGSIVLHESDIQRQKERLAWAERMLGNGYISESQFLKEKSILQQAEVALATDRGALATLDRFTAPLQIKRLQSAVEQARLELDFQTQRHQNRAEQLESYRKQVEACTIRAPHPGRVIYANAFNPRLRIEPGAFAYNHMALFYLPDLTQLEIHAELHESMIQRVHPGQPAKIRIGSLPRQTLDGHVKSVDPLPKEARNWKTSREVRNFLAKIVLHAAPAGVLPGMSAEVEIVGETRPGALVVPSSAVTLEGDDEIVYVPSVNRLEKRSVQVEPGDSRYVEVRSGLTEGEEVILDPLRLDPAEALAAESNPDNSERQSGL
jgi:HlyD family secretion protein